MGFLQGGKKIGSDCLIEISSIGSFKGKWTETDKQRFREQLGKEQGVINLGDYKTQWIECCLDKIEKAYSSYSEAMTDLEGSQKFTLECNEEFNLSK